MDAAVGQGYITKALSLSAESYVHTVSLLAVLETAPPSKPAATHAGLARLAAETRRKIAPIIEHILSSAEQTLKLIKQAMDVEEVVPLGEHCWQMALLAIAQDRKMLIEHCSGKTRARFTRGRVSAWLPSWDTRCNKLLERIEDISETIALGLNEEMRGEIEGRIQAIRDLKTE